MNFVCPRCAARYGWARRECPRCARPNPFSLGRFLGAIAFLALSVLAIGLLVWMTTREAPWHDDPASQRFRTPSQSAPTDPKFGMIP